MKVIVTGLVSKQCPYRDEPDEGTVSLEFHVPVGDGPELHALAERLRSYAGQALSHEAFTREIADVTGARRVYSTWQTAGLDVTCEVP